MPLGESLLNILTCTLKLFSNTLEKNIMDLESKRDEDKMALIQALVVNKKLDVKDIMVMVADFLMVGIEMTSHSTGFLLYHFARNPDK
ncbi:hypothetical protein NPIL_435211 [Nephila pilipes]|uniref:Cytochrome P450 n=1 Tax=Nephila pilipes TaxID=299642 RepID=A0A8X6MGZ4_NEPPI|nr:hypothetical protein NPIL_435211 [Nephila pilipes]